MAIELSPLRVLVPEVVCSELEFPRFDLSLEHRRATDNAVVYEAMNPSRARYTGSQPLSRFIGKRTPG